MMSASTTSTPPNHHAGHAGFHGIGALVAATTFLVGRSDDAALACDLTETGPGDHVVDVGCGPGVAVRAAARRGARSTGVDPAPMMLRVARIVTRDVETSWIEGTAESLPVGDGEATVLWSIATVHHWADIEGGLSNARRVLAPGGRLLAIERRRHPESTGHASHGWTDEQAEAFATACDVAGFADLRVGTHRSRRGVLLCVLGTRG
jgi:ubiquinone/menaquinone biosynthesis C-methylase UbiE